ncbi:MAG: hypothetical protein ACLFTU_11640, partial [Puniceicoccaceae bacterium]
MSAHLGVRKGPAPWIQGKGAEGQLGEEFDVADVPSRVHRSRSPGNKTQTIDQYRRNPIRINTGFLVVFDDLF